MFEWTGALKIRHTKLFLDCRNPCEVCFISHAHSDHLGVHEHVICTPETAALAEHRVGLPSATLLAYAQELRIDSMTNLRLLPAGHVLGSAMLHVSRPEGTLLYTGDFKLRPSLTVQSAEPMPADVLVMESTYGRPVFRFPPREAVVTQLLERVEDAMQTGRQSIVMGYSLGKSQEIARILTNAGFAVTLHGAANAICQIYQRLGISLGPLRTYRREDFHGDRALDLRERGVLVAPPHVARSSFVTAFPNPLRIILTGWAMLKDVKYRYGVDHALPLSDHADFDELLEIIERVKPKKIYTHHGFREFVDELRMRGHDAEPACPDRQLALFD